MFVSPVWTDEKHAVPDTLLFSVIDKEIWSSDNGTVVYVGGGL